MRRLLLILVLAFFVAAARPFDSLTVFPDTGDPGTTSVDGDVGTNGASTYATAHSTADCTDCSGTTVAATENSCTKLASPCNNLSCSVLRFVTNFDTSSLGASATISAATLSVKPNLIPRNDNADFVRVVTTGDSDNDLVLGHFASFGTTGQASDVNISSMTAEVYTDFALNATGLANISKTGVTKFGLRCGTDISNTEPLPADSDCVVNSANGTIVFFHTADQTGTGSDPKLAITYTLPGGGRQRTVVINAMVSRSSRRNL